MGVCGLWALGVRIVVRGGEVVGVFVDVGSGTGGDLGVEGGRGR